ncbi:MAG: DUF2164 domain-containing protein [Candidatus Thermoplasmatota archaeon]
MAILLGERRSDAVARIQEHFRAERGEALGELGATLLLDFVERELGPAFYNQGVRDAKARVAQSHNLLAEELDVLEVVPKPAKKR